MKIVFTKKNVEKIKFIIHFTFRIQADNLFSGRLYNATDLRLSTFDIDKIKMYRFNIIRDVLSVISPAQTENTFLIERETERIPISNETRT